MTIIIDGTLGISGVDGSAGTPAYAGNDSDTGLWYPASNTLALSTGGTERMRITSSGFVGIGTSNPGANLQIGSATFAPNGNLGNNLLQIKSPSGFAYLTIGNGDTANSTSYIGGASGFTTIGSVTDAGALTEHMRITNTGNVGIGTSSVSRRFEVHGTPLSIGGSATGVLVSVVNNSTAFNSSPTSAITLWNRFNSAGSTFPSAALQGGKENATDGNYAGFMSFFTVDGGGGVNERMRISSGGNVGIGTNNPVYPLQVSAGSSGSIAFMVNPSGLTNFAVIPSNSGTTGTQIGTTGGDTLAFITNNSEKMRIESGGNVLVGTTVYNDAFKGILLSNNGRLYAIADGAPPLTLNRLTNDGDLVEFKQAGTIEGTISVSGTTVSYNGGHLSRWSQLPNNQKDDTLLKGTVMSNLDDMCVWVKEGEELPNEQLNKMKISDVEGDTNVAGVFVNWTFDEQSQSDDMNVAMTGDMIIRIAQSVVVQKGDLLMSAGDGTAKPQGDDIVRSKTIAKVTSNHVTCTYADGSYCVPCVLMAC